MRDELAARQRPESKPRPAAGQQDHKRVPAIGHSAVLALQRLAGNTAVSRLLNGAPSVQRCGGRPCDCPEEREIAVQRACDHSSGSWTFEYDGCSLPPGVSLVVGTADKDNPAGGPDTQFSDPGGNRDKPCDLHDKCYQTCDTRPTARAECDRQMYERMMAVCLEAKKSGKSDDITVERCFHYAGVYSIGLGAFGQGAFDGRQSEVCSCRLRTPPPAPPVTPPTPAPPIPTPPSTPIPRHVIFSASTLFEFREDQLRPSAKAELLATLGEQPRRADLTQPFTVEGHTDSKGSDEFNMGLSIRRAQAVAKLLKEHYQNLEGHIDAPGFGESRPIAPNTFPNGADNPEGRRRNRRVEIHFSELVAQ